MNKHIAMVISTVTIVGTLVGCGMDSGGMDTDKINPDTSLVDIEFNSEMKGNAVSVDAINAYKKLDNCQFNDLDDNEYNMWEFEGKPTIIHFWGPWCNPCMDEMVYFEELYTEYKDDVNFLMISTTDDKIGDSLIEYKDKYPFEIYYSKDDKINSTYSISEIPTTYFVNKQGFIIESFEKAQEYEVLLASTRRLIGE